MVDNETLSQQVIKLTWLSLGHWNEMLIIVLSQIDHEFLSALR